MNVFLKNHLSKIILKEVPREVTIKFYQKKHFRLPDGNHERLTDTVIGLLCSQTEVGPKVYGIFDDGIIQGYYKVMLLC